MVAAFAVTALVFFAAGVAAAHYVIGEAVSIKQHVSNEVEKLRGDLKAKL